VHPRYCKPVCLQCLEATDDVRVFNVLVHIGGSCTPCKQQKVNRLSRKTPRGFNFAVCFRIAPATVLHEMLLAACNFVEIPISMASNLSVVSNDYASRFKYNYTYPRLKSAVFISRLTADNFTTFLSEKMCILLQLDKHLQSTLHERFHRCFHYSHVNRCRSAISQCCRQ